MWNLGGAGGVLTWWWCGGWSAGWCCCCPGMRHAFGKPSGRVARVAIGQVREQAHTHMGGDRTALPAWLPA